MIALATWLTLRHGASVMLKAHQGCAAANLAAAVAVVAACVADGKT